MKTDSDIQKDVIAELNWEPSISAEQIGVTVKDGIVTLTGHVRSFAEKWESEQAAMRVSGVRALAVEIDVTLPGSSQRHDGDIARSVENVLEWASYLPKDSVSVMVENGWITLTGEVEWGYQRQAAVAAVRYLMGVTGVSDNITIRPSISISAVKADIEAALKRGAKADAEKISVAVHGSDVTLTGTVRSWQERHLARTSAWSTPGVRNVVDNINVIF
ncbi:BON domain-containing protein [Undibacterium sp. TJN25]|uniref:BON domain-containing protein n=1 Tax=Undibacterium sp. TJN25 TaxID=3413056 RepID=UPI003BF06299